MQREWFGVLARSRTGWSAALSDWYEAVHLPEILGHVPAATAARRYDLIHAADLGRPGLESFESLTVFETDRTARLVWDDIRRARDLATSPALDYSSVTPLFI